MAYLHYTGIIVVIFSIMLGVGSNDSLVTGFDRHCQEAIISAINTAAFGIALQSDGKIVVAGTAGTDFAVARYNPDGSLDIGFDDDGKVTTSFGINASGSGVTIQPDEKIVVAGTAGSDFTLVRYNSDGSLDPGFDYDGKVTTSFGTNATGSDVIIQTNGKIVLVGTAGTDIAVARYNPDGSLDLGFDGDGKATTSFATNATGAAVILQPDGKIVVAGTAGPDFAIVRYNPEGSLDPTFGVNGKTITDFYNNHDSGNAITLQPDNKVVVSGSTGVFYGSKFALARYNPDGSLDPNFGDNGKVTTDISSEYEYGYAVTIQPDNKIIVAGAVGIFCMCDFPPTDFVITRYNPDGSLDPGFGNGGVVTTDISGDNDWGYALILQTEGKIILAGASGDSFYGDSTPNVFAMARYNPDGSLDTSFSEDGKVTTSFLTIIRFYLPLIQK